MAIVTGTYETFSAKGIREDLADVIYNISPEDTPFMANIGRGSAKNTFHEWQTDTLDAATTDNAQLQGDDIESFPAQDPTARVGNYTQILRKLVAVADTLEVVDKAGRKSDLAYQLAKKGAEIKRDLESVLLTNQGATAGSSGTPPTMASMGAWIKTNVNKASDGANPTWDSGAPTAGRTDGTQRAFDEPIMKDVIQQGWTNGAGFKVVMVGPHNKIVFSTFTGRATNTFYQSAAKLAAVIGAADVYVSDFGNLSVVPNRFQRERDAWFLDPSYASLHFLRPFKTVELAKTGDAEKRMLITEVTLKVHTELAHGLAADLTTAA